jgi:anti-sigma B factor antagonist
MINVELIVGDFGGYTVVALRGGLDVADVPAVESHLIATVAACGPSVIVDMAGLEFIDCCGLGVLVRVLKWTRARGGDMFLAAPPQHVRRILRLTGLIGVFPLYPSVPLAASGASRQVPRHSLAFSSQHRPPVSLRGWPPRCCCGAAITRVAPASCRRVACPWLTESQVH